MLLPSIALANAIKGVRTHESPDYIRVVLDTSKASNYSIFALDNPHRIVIDVKDAKPARELSLGSAEGLTHIKGLRGGKRENGYRIVVDTEVAFRPKSFTLKPIAPYGHRLVADLYFPKGTGKAAQAALPSRKAAVQGGRDIMIAIDPGHGGEDPGALGPRKILEKDVVLQIARRTMNQIKSKKGFDAFLIRDGDYYLGHRQRTALARNRRADLFVSIHADAFREKSAHGASVYALSMRGATSTTAQYLADTENAADLVGGVELAEMDPMLAGVLADLSMTGTLDTSLILGALILEQIDGVARFIKSGWSRQALRY